MTTWRVLNESFGQFGQVICNSVRDRTSSRYIRNIPEIIVCEGVCVCMACSLYSMFFGVQVMAMSDFSVVEFFDHSLSVVPTSWVFRDDKTLNLHCYWNSSTEKAKKAVRPHPKWTTCKIKKIVAHKGRLYH